MDPLNVSEEICETTIHDLPSELLIPIFNNLTTDTLQNVARVSKYWRCIIHEEIGLEISVSDFGVPKRNAWCRTPKQLGDEVIKICHARMITGPISYLKKPEKLEILYFKAPLLARVYQTLTYKAINLSKIYFLHTSLSNDNISKVGPYLNLPNLKLLHLCDRSLESGDPTHPGFIPKNINFFLQQHFSSLRELVVSTVTDRTNTKCFGLDLLYFVQKHYNTLRILKFNVASTILGMQLFAPNILHHYESIQLSREEKRDLDWTKLNQVAFKTLELDFGENYVVGLLEWNRILDCQSHLQSLVLFKCAPVPLRLFTNLILQSCQNLVYIQIGVQIVDDEQNTIPVDCSLFEVCRGLRKFGLFGNNGISDRPLTKQLINCDKLPKTILALFLKNIIIESCDLDTIIFGCHHVVKLTLDTVGNKEQFGMTLKLLDKIMMKKKCLEMIVKTFNNIDAVQFPDLVNEFEKESFTVSTLPNCHFHAKFKHELNQYIFICV